MRLLLDTHVVIWAVERPLLLSQSARKALEDPSNDLVVSAVTIWEIAIKVGLNKLVLSSPYRQWMNQALSDLGATAAVREPSLPTVGARQVTLR